MKLKRITLIVCLIIYSIVCFEMMNTRYNPLARYPYATKENRDIIVDYMDQDDIDYLIQQKIKPEQFMNFITLEGFKTKNILFYDVCKKEGMTDLNYVISFVNTYRKNSSLKTFSSLLQNYGYKAMEAFYDGEYPYVKDATLVNDPSSINTVINDKQSVYTYVPRGLVMIDNSIVPHINGSSEGIYVKEEMIEDLKKMLNALEEFNGMSAGGLILTSGYVSYLQQITNYEKALMQYGVDNFTLYEDYPGQSERQLGYTISFTIAQIEEEKIKDSEQVKWLNEHAGTYGFILSYPENKQEETGKLYQPLTFTYVGIQNVKE